MKIKVHGIEGYLIGLKADIETTTYYSTEEHEIICYKVELISESDPTVRITLTNVKPKDIELCLEE